MKVILLEDIKSVGKKGEVIDASDGYARNFLLPKKLAKEATKAALNELQLKNKSLENKALKELEAAKLTAKNIEEKKLVIKVKVGENNKLFGSVTNKEIAQAIKEQFNIDIDKKKINLSEPIKTIGEKKIEVKVHSKVSANLVVSIISI